MFLGNDFSIQSLNNFITGFAFAGGKTYDKSLNYPDFALFTNWLGGRLNYKYEASAMNWSWLLLNKFKDDKKAFAKFFYYLDQFKKSEPEVIMIKINKKNIQQALGSNLSLLWCGISNSPDSYSNNLQKVDRVILYKLRPGKTLFCLLLSKNNKVLESRNTDITGKVLQKKIERQFGIRLDNRKAISLKNSRTLLHQHKLI